MQPTTCVLTVLLAMGASAHGADFFVAPGGQDGHPGTKAQPLGTPEPVPVADRGSDRRGS